MPTTAGVRIGSANAITSVQRGGRAAGRESTPIWRPNPVAAHLCGGGRRADHGAVKGPAEKLLRMRAKGRVWGHESLAANLLAGLLQRFVEGCLRGLTRVRSRD